jgi:hypothetical protein
VAGVPDCAPLGGGGLPGFPLGGPPEAGRGGADTVSPMSGPLEHPARNREAAKEMIKARERVFQVKIGDSSSVGAEPRPCVGPRFEAG